MRGKVVGKVGLGRRHPPSPRGRYSSGVHASFGSSLFFNKQVVISLYSPPESALFLQLCKHSVISLQGS